MDLMLAGKRALVTGSSSGIGSAIARILAAEGVAVVVHGRDRERGTRVAEEIAHAGGRATVALGDLSCDEGAAVVAETAIAAFGGIDILVNNAGGSSGGGVAQWSDYTILDYANTFNVNALAGLRLTHLLAPAMLERGWGRIIAISSALARHSMGMMHDYAAAKVAVESISLNLSMNMAPSGVTVNTVVPGVILTPGAEHYLELLRTRHDWPNDLGEVQKRYIAQYSPQPVPRLGRPEEIGNVVAFLASPLSDYTTGAVLRVDGGMTRSL